MQILKPHLRPTDSDFLEVEPRTRCCNKLLGRFWCMLKLRSTVVQLSVTFFPPKSGYQQDRRSAKEDLGIGEGTRGFSADFSVSPRLLTPYVIRTSSFVPSHMLREAHSRYSGNILIELNGISPLWTQQEPLANIQHGRTGMVMPSRGWGLPESAGSAVS